MEFYCDPFLAAAELDPSACTAEEAWPSPTEGWPDALSAAPPRGTFFDPNVEFAGAGGEALTAEILKLLPKQEGRGRRVRRADQFARVRAILANGLRCLHRDPPLVAYFRGPYYSGEPAWLRGPALARAVDGLATAELLVSNRGRRHTASTYALTDKLIGIASSCGVTREAIVARVPQDMLLRLYGAKPRRKPWEPKSKGELLKFELDEERLRWTAELETINAFIATHKIGLSASAQDGQRWLDHLNAVGQRSGALLCKPELIQTDLYRVFNNGSFEEGGRLFGGWWLYAPKDLRKLITLDGQSTVELDYSGCHINMLYHERGLECEGDPYELVEISEYETEMGLKPRTYRSCIKQYTQTLINCRNGGHPSRIELKEGTPFPSVFKPIEIVRMIERKHDPIKCAFRTNSGLRLQRIESDIAVEVVTIAMREGWLALPVHDSFVAVINKEHQLRSIMKSVYLNKFGLEIHVSPE